MNIWFGLFLIAAAIIVGILYWDKIREVKKLERMVVQETAEIATEYSGLAVFVYETKEEMQSDIAEAATDLAARGSIHPHRRKEHKWGYEVEFDTGYKIFFCDPRIEIPHLPVHLVFIDHRMTADQTIKVLREHDGHLTEVFLYTEDEV